MIEWLLVLIRGRYSFSRCFRILVFKWLISDGASGFVTRLKVERSEQITGSQGHWTRKRVHEKYMIESIIGIRRD